MAESSLNLEVQGQPNKIGPDIIGFCKSEILELLTLDESFLPLSFSTPQVSSDTPENVKETVEISQVSTMFSNSMDDSISNIKRELLKTSLRKSVKAITHEVDEMLDPIIRLRHLMSCLGSKRKAPIAEDSGIQHHKKLKISSSDGGRGLLVDQSGNADKETDVSVDLKVLLESEDDLVEDIMTKHSDELHVTLNNMEKQLEELLFAVVSKCRPMTCEEKHHLRKLIQKLPARNLGRIVEIIHHGKSKSSSDTVSLDKIYVDLEEQDNTTLWRLYFYVKAVENARKLSS